MNVTLVPMPVRRPRWGLRIVALLLTAVLVAAALAPSIVSWSPALRDRLIRRFVGDLQARVVVDGFSVGWLAPLRIDGLRIVPPEGEPLIAIERIESDRQLWRMLVSPDDVGTFRVERPVVNVELHEDGSNFRRAFASIRSAPRPPRGLELGGHVRVVDGTLRCRSDARKEPWAIAGLNLGVGWRPGSRSPSGKPELLVDRGKLLDHCDLSVGLCDDLLKFIAPVLARVAHVHGEVTIDLDDWRLPWNDFGSGELSGRITMHTVDAGPGALVQSILDMPVLKSLLQRFPLPALVQLARESTIPFQMQAGRIYHEHLRFNLADVVDVETRGSAGLDHTLDLTAVLGIHPPNAAQAPVALLRTLTSHPWPVRIHGRFGAVQVDPSPLADSGWDLLSRTLQDIQTGNPSVGGRAFEAMNNLGIQIQPAEVAGLIELLRPRGTASGASAPPPMAGPSLPAPPAPNPPRANPPAAQAEATGPSIGPTLGAATGEIVPAPSALPDPNTTTARPVVPAPPAAMGAGTPPPGPESIVPPAVELGADIAAGVLGELARRRREREAAAAANAQFAPPGAAVPPPPPPPRRPLIRRGLNLLLEAASTPPAAAPTATPTGTAAPNR